MCEKQPPNKSTYKYNTIYKTHIRQSKPRLKPQKNDCTRAQLFFLRELVKSEGLPALTVDLIKP